MEKCHKSKSFREILPNLAPGYIFMSGRSAASKIIYGRPVGSPETLQILGDNPTPDPNRAADFSPKIICGTFSALRFGNFSPAFSQF